MATVAQVDAAVAAKVETLAQAPTRMASDYRADLEGVQAGSTKYQLRTHLSAFDHRDANNTLQVASVEVSLHRKLSGAERDYTLDEMLSAQLALVDPKWWEAIAEIKEVRRVGGARDGPEIVDEPERIGNIVSYTVAVRVLVQQ